MKNRNLISLLTIFLPMFIYGQAVVGVVNDEEGDPLGGANVVVEGTDKGGVTDETGKYTIDVGAPGTYDITASYIGYSTLTSQVEVNDIVGTLNLCWKRMFLLCQLLKSWLLVLMKTHPLLILW